MKALLSPLLPTQLFCGHCFAERDARDTTRWQWWRFELAHMPPLGRFSPATGFVPDYPVLLMFDEFVIDGEAVERITRAAGDPWLGPWPEIIQILTTEGSLRPIDVTPDLASVAHQRSAMTQRDMRDPARWVGPMEYHDSIFLGADTAFRPNEPALSASYDWTYDPSRHPAVEASDGLYHQVAPLLRADQTELDAVHVGLRERALLDLKSQLREVNAISALAAKHSAACMYWAPYAKYLESKATVNDSPAEAARLFFELAFPLFRPKTIRQFARLRGDRRLTSLRTEIERAVKSGDVFDREYPQRIIMEVLRAEREVGQDRKILGYLAAPLNFVPGLGLAPTVAAEGIGEGYERLKKRQPDWFYLISDGVGIS